MKIEFTCSICGKKFLGDKRLLHSKKPLVCPDLHALTCKYCGSKFTQKYRGYIPKCCSRECSMKLGRQNAENTNLTRYGVRNCFQSDEAKEKIRNTNIQKYGVPVGGNSLEGRNKARNTWKKRYGVDNPSKSIYIRDKVKKTCEKKYGTESPLSKGSPVWDKIRTTNLERYGTMDPGNRPEAIEHRKQTNLSRFGTEWYTQTYEYKERIRDISLRKYGVSHFTKSAVVKEHFRETMIKHYGVDSPMHNPESVSKLSDTIMKKYGVPWPCMTPQCVSSSISTISKINISFSELLIDRGISSDFEFRVENRMFDLVLPECHTLIEIDPTYTHSCEPVARFGNIDMDYHRNKTALGNTHGYRVIHIFSWDDFDGVADVVDSSNYADSDTINISRRTVSNIDTKFLHSHKYKSIDISQINTILSVTNDKTTVCIIPCSEHNDILDVLGFYFNSGYYSTKTIITSIEYMKSRYKEILIHLDIAKDDPRVISNLQFDIVRDLGPVIHWSKDKHHFMDAEVYSHEESPLAGLTKQNYSEYSKDLMSMGWLPIYDCGHAVYRWCR